MAGTRWFMLSVMALTLAGGTAAQQPDKMLSRFSPSSAPSKERDPAKSDVVFIVGGVGGWDTLAASAKVAFPLAGLRHDLRDFVWTHGWGKMFRDLQDFRHAELKAEELAAQIQQVRAQFPERRVFVLAKSGGTGLALRAAELLPPDSLERIVLISAAVTPAYDLRPALRATRGEIVSFYSPFDQVILNWGTRNFGTIDRYYGPSAGLRGFAMPGELNSGDRDLYRRLVQISWNPRMIWQGYVGGHVANSFPAFLAAEVGPWLR